ncbi:9163_t:CDS:1, partial [Acaulospora morrowiae]
GEYKLQPLRKRKHEELVSQSDDELSNEEYPPPTLTNWEDEVDEVETVERNNKDHSLLVYLNW